jgi:putative tryptophan/tyrosine transport system substrate-binding protein
VLFGSLDPKMRTQSEPASENAFCLCANSLIFRIFYRGRFLDMVGVTGSIPVAPTSAFNDLILICGAHSAHTPATPGDRIPSQRNRRCVRGSEPAFAAKAATSKIPIVFANGSDPVKVGLVESLNRPGENITGVTFLLNTLGPKVLQILYSLQPKSKRVAVLLNPNLATTASQTRDVEDAGNALGLEIQIFHASTDGDIERVFTSIDQMRAGGMLIGADAFFFSRRDQLVGLAKLHSIATVYPWREAVIAGGLASYGANITDAYALAGTLTSRILKGDKPAELPVQQSIKTEFVLNLKTARTLQLDIPPTLSALADEVIE